MGRIASSVSGLGTASDGAEGIVRLDSSRQVRLRWNQSAGVWVSAPQWSMRQTSNVGLSTNGSSLAWKYPGASTEIPFDPAEKGSGFYIHMLTDAGAYWAAGLRLQEFLTGRILDIGPGVTTPEFALNWYPLAPGDGFLSPTPTNQGVRLFGELAQPKARFYTSGWQNTVLATSPTAGQDLYPEIYQYGSIANLWNFTARRRWVSSDATAAGPPSFARPPIANLINWHVADDIPVANGAAVGDWADYSGWGRNLVSSGTKRPVLNKNTLNGHATVAFDGVNDIMQTPVAAANQPWSAFLVMRQRASGGTQQVWLGTNGASAPLFYRGSATDQVNLWLGGTDLTYARGSNWPSPWIVISIVCNGASTNIWEGKTLKATGDAGSFGFTGLVIGNNFAETLPAAIDVAEIILAYKAADSTERNAVIDQLNTKYGL
jgi:hypothetical protein